MGNLDLLLDAASLATELTMVGQLNEMRQRGAAQAAVQQILAALRNEIFKFSEASKNILATEEQNQKIAAGAMRLLEYRLYDSGISPDWFFELGDKEYVSNTFRTIESNAQRLINSLRPEDKTEVENVARKVSRLNDYNYYLANYSKFIEYRLAFPKSKGLGNGSGVCGCLFLASAGFSGMLLLSMAGGVLQSSEAGVAGVGLTLLLVGAVVVSVPFFIGSALTYFGFRGGSAKSIVGRIGKELSVNLMTKLDNEFQGNLQEVQRLRDEAQELAKQFFGGSPLLNPN